jgi:hypothetical protein
LELRTTELTWLPRHLWPRFRRAFEYDTQHQLIAFNAPPLFSVLGFGLLFVCFFVSPAASEQNTKQATPVPVPASARQRKQLLAQQRRCAALCVFSRKKNARTTGKRNTRATTPPVGASP